MMLVGYCLGFTGARLVLQLFGDLQGRDVYNLFTTALNVGSSA